MNYYQFSIGDYRRDTTHLSMLEHGAYRQLLDWFYLDEQPIPRETEVVFRRLSARTEEEQKAIQIVLNEMFLLTDSGYTHTRCMQEITAYQGKAERARKAGKLGGRPKKTEEVIPGLSEKTEAKANHEPLTINQEPYLKPIPVSPAFILPDWINQEHWNLWLKTRKGKKMLPEQKQAQVDKLNGWKVAGLDYGKALKDAAVNGWQGLFEPKPQSAPGKPPVDNFAAKEYGTGVTLL